MQEFNSFVCEQGCESPYATGKFEVLFPVKREHPDRSPECPGCGERMTPAGVKQLYRRSRVLDELLNAGELP